MDFDRQVAIYAGLHEFATDPDTVIERETDLTRCMKVSTYVLESLFMVYGTAQETLALPMLTKGIRIMKRILERNGYQLKDDYLEYRGQLAIENPKTPSELEADDQNKGVDKETTKLASKLATQKVRQIEMLRDTQDRN